jgi:hypothetical protein
MSLCQKTLPLSQTIANHKDCEPKPSSGWDRLNMRDKNWADSPHPPPQCALHIRLWSVAAPFWRSRTFLFALLSNSWVFLWFLFGNISKDSVWKCDNKITCITEVINKALIWCCPQDFSKVSFSSGNIKMNKWLLDSQNRGPPLDLEKHERILMREVTSFNKHLLSNFHMLGSDTVCQPWEMRN